MRKAAVFLLICVLFLSCILPAASAEPLPAQERISGEFAYVLKDDGSAMITRYDGKQAVLNVPQALDGIAVTAVGSHTFQANDALTQDVNALLEKLVPGGAAYCFGSGVLSDSLFPDVFIVKYSDIGK